MAREFSYEIKNGHQVFDSPEERKDFLVKKPDGYRGFERHRPVRRAKSNLQLGYYWGLLVIEITKQLTELGWTITMGRGEHSFERYYTKDDTHEWLKKHCAKVGDDGAMVTLSEQDQHLCYLYINNVLLVAERWLKMDRLALESKRPSLK